jgi:DNA invertase Pin-like site-specific DNA recombinase
MSFIGYARVSTTSQDYDLQIEALKKAGCNKIFSEKQSASSMKSRTQLKECLNYLRDGDTLVITRIDRLARSLRDLQNLVHDLKNKGIDLKATEQPINTSSAAGKAFLDMLGVFAEFETNLRKERQLDGIEKAKANGKYKGRKPTAQAKAQQVKDMTKKGMTRQAVANELNMGIASVYRILSKSPKLSPLSVNASDV